VQKFVVLVSILGEIYGQSSGRPHINISMYTPMLVLRYFRKEGKGKNAEI